MADNRTAAPQDVFDIANWLERANRRVGAPAQVAATVAAPVAAVPTAPAAPTAPARAVEYVPRHRADVAADSVA